MTDTCILNFYFIINIWWSKSLKYCENVSGERKSHSWSWIWELCSAGNIFDNFILIFNHIPIHIWKLYFNIQSNSNSLPNICTKDKHFRISHATPQSGLMTINNAQSWRRILPVRYLTKLKMYLSKLKMYLCKFKVHLSKFKMYLYKLNMYLPEGCRYYNLYPYSIVGWYFYQESPERLGTILWKGFMTKDMQKVAISQIYLKVLHFEFSQQYLLIFCSFLWQMTQWQIDFSLWFWRTAPNLPTMASLPLWGAQRERFKNPSHRIWYLQWSFSHTKTKYLCTQIIWLKNRQKCKLKDSLTGFYESLLCIVWIKDESCPVNWVCFSFIGKPLHPHFSAAGTSLFFVEKYNLEWVYV